MDFELLRSTLQPGCRAGPFLACAAALHEYVVVEAGQLRLTVGDAWADLETGDSAYFVADAVRSYDNNSATPCTFYIATLSWTPHG